MGMGVIVWLLIPLTAMVIAMVWTAVLSRRERRRADERWRAQRLAELGGVLSVTDTPLGEESSGDSGVTETALGGRSDE